MPENSSRPEDVEATALTPEELASVPEPPPLPGERKPVGRPVGAETRAVDHSLQERGDAPTTDRDGSARAAAPPLSAPPRGPTGPEISADAQAAPVPPPLPPRKTASSPARASTDQHSAKPTASRSWPLLLLGGLLAAGAIGVLIAFFGGRTDRSAVEDHDDRAPFAEVTPSHRLMIVAGPWGMVESVERIEEAGHDDGEESALPSSGDGREEGVVRDARTGEGEDRGLLDAPIEAPVVLEVPPGTYEARVTHPDWDGDPLTCRVRVGRGRESVCVVKVPSLTADEYWRDAGWPL